VRQGDHAVPVHRFRWLLVCALVTSAVAAVHVAATRRNLFDETARFGCCNRSEIILRTRSLCCCFSDKSEELIVSASQMEAEGSITRRFWTVDCTDAAGNYIACFTWDAGTGDLYHVGHHSSKVSGRGTPPMSREAAVRIARCWLSSMGIADRNSPWTVAGEPEQFNNIWHIAWRVPGRTAFTQIDVWSGDLLMAKSCRR
jgi:hypothetical protein